MSLSVSWQLIIEALGVTVRGVKSPTAVQGIEPIDTTLPKGKAGTLTTSTIAMVTGHGLSDGTFDVHGVGWCRYGCTIDFTGDSAAVTGGAGDALADGAVVVTPAVTFDETFDGDNLVLIGVGSSRQVSVRFMHDATVVKPVLLLAGGAWGWGEDTGGTNELTGDPITSVVASCGDAAYDSDFKLTGAQNAVT